MIRRDILKEIFKDKREFTEYIVITLIIGFPLLSGFTNSFIGNLVSYLWGLFFVLLFLLKEEHYLKVEINGKEKDEQ